VRDALLVIDVCEGSSHKSPMSYIVRGALIDIFEGFEAVDCYEMYDRKFQAGWFIK